MADVERRQLGRSGLALSALGLGCNNFGMLIDAAATDAVVGCALDVGITHFDTAEVYSAGESERLLGAALGARRDEAVIATKFGSPTTPTLHRPGSRANVRRACEASLRNLSTDRIDLYYQHRPDPTTPVEETLDALHDLVTEGKILYAAASNFTADQIDASTAAAREGRYRRFEGQQLEWSLLARDVEADVVPTCRRHDVGIVPYFPLASGLLTGKHVRGEPFAEDTRMSRPYFAAVATDENWDRVERLQEVAATCGRSILELAIGWLLSQAGVSSVLIGATKPGQVEANVAAADWRLSPDDLALVDAACGVNPGR